MFLNHGIVFGTYLADNSVFEHNQRIFYCGLNAHHKNGVAKWLIHTVSEKDGAVMLHSSLCF